jgi:hypothetical protein
MTNSQQTIKLDLSSLLTETSAHSDNQYTSSALELLLNDNREQSAGAGFLDVVVAATKKGAQQLGPAIKAAGQDAVRSASPFGDRGRAAVRSAAGLVSNAIKTSPERLRALGNQVSNAVRNSPERLRAVAAKARPGSERIQQAAQSAIDKLSPRSREIDTTELNTAQNATPYAAPNVAQNAAPNAAPYAPNAAPYAAQNAEQLRNHLAQYSDTSSATVDGDKQALVLIHDRVKKIEEGIEKLFRILKSR